MKCEYCGRMYPEGYFDCKHGCGAPLVRDRPERVEYSYHYELRTNHRPYMYVDAYTTTDSSASISLAPSPNWRTHYERY